MAEIGITIPRSLEAKSIPRYSRQMLVKDVGVDGQIKISSSRVLVIGAGGLGSAIIPYLAGAGVKELGVIDPDIVDETNLHRQVIHQEADSGKSTKVSSAFRFVQQLNKEVCFNALCEPLNEHNAMKIIADYDIIVDASDNPRTRYLVNDACVLSGKPLVSGSAIGLEGQLTVLNCQGGPCYRCIYPRPGLSPSCSDNGVVGPVCGVIGSLQVFANRTLKYMHDAMIRVVIAPHRCSGR
jgi:adenylyltransferase/sulfurtransferase